MGEITKIMKFIFIFVVMLIVTYFLWNKKREQNLKLEQENLLLQRKIALEHYQSLKEQVELTQRFREEIVSHMETLQHIVENAGKYSKEAEAYAESLRRQYDRLCSPEYCEQFVEDACKAPKMRELREDVS